MTHQQVSDCVKSLDLPPPVNIEGSGIEGSEAGVVSWSPPTQNWNPWTGCNIDEGPLASASMDDISHVSDSNSIE